MRSIILALTFLAVTGCCKQGLENLQTLRVEGSSADGTELLVYDANTDTLAWVDTRTLKVIAEYKNWNKRAK